MHTASAPRQTASCWSLPSTAGGWLAPLLAAAAVGTGLVGEAMRGEGVAPYYRIALLLAVLGAAVAVSAFRRGERSVVSMLSLIPLVFVVAFGVAELL